MGKFLYFGGGFDPFFHKLYENLSNTTIDRINYTSIHLVDEKDRLAGYIIYCDYTGFGISMHVYLTKALTRTTIRNMFSYPFLELNVKRLFIEFESANIRVKNIAERLGFHYIASIDNFFSDSNDKIIMVAEYNDIKRWLE